MDKFKKIVIISEVEPVPPKYGLAAVDDTVVDTHVEYTDVGEAVQCFPFLADVVLISNDDDVLEFAVVVVAGT